MIPIVSRLSDVRGILAKVQGWFQLTRWDKLLFGSDFIIFLV